MQGRQLALLFALCASFGVVTCDEDDGTFLPQELSATISRLSSRGVTTQLHTVSDLAIPTQAYANAFADMRSPLPSFQPNPFSASDTTGINAMKLSLPGFALKEVPSGGSQRNADLRTHGALDNPIKLGIPDALLRVRDRVPASTELKSVGTSAMSPSTDAATRDSVLKDLVGLSMVRPGQEISLGQAAALSDAALAAADTGKTEAMDRLMSKHSALNTGTEVKEPRMPGSPQRGIHMHKASTITIDNNIKSYHGVLAKAVMILAALAGTAICGGICGVVYCWKTRDRSYLNGKDGDNQRDDPRGKNFGRATPRYGSYGMGRRV